MRIIRVFSASISSGVNRFSSGGFFSVSVSVEHSLDDKVNSAHETACGDNKLGILGFGLIGCFLIL